MKFRPCIDIHNGKVKQVVGGSLSDAGDFSKENFVSAGNAAHYACLYKERGLFGGHVIILDKEGTAYHAESLRQATDALKAFKGGLQIGGGVNIRNAAGFLDAGASHVIVTSYVFRDGLIDFDRLEAIAAVTGKERLVLDLSCRKKNDGYYIVTDRWRTFTETTVSAKTLETLSEYCGEFLIHAADVEGKISGIERDLVRLLGSCGGLPVTYAGGISSFDDVEQLAELSGGRLDFTIGSALDIFGGGMSFEEVVSRYAVR
jgi:phosphoribosylformimino-5-aminoimidazole carboxamide ribotide isomerase